MAGVTQFIDIGSGLPTRPSTHEIAQSVNRNSRVAYVDNDPLVVIHAAALEDRLLRRRGHQSLTQADPGIAPGAGSSQLPRERKAQWHLSGT